MKSFLPFLACLMTLSVSSPVAAELMGLVAGRSAYIPTQATTSVEVGASWYTKQLQWTAARINFKPAPVVITYLDFAVLRATDLSISNTRLADFIGPGFGGGIMFAVPDFLVKHDVAFKASYHASVIDETGFNESTAGLGAVKQSLQQSQWNASFMLSPIDPLYENGTTWYSSLGFVSTEARSKGEPSALGVASAVDYRQVQGAALGVGLFRPLSKGRIYAGFEWLSGDPLVGAGISYAFR